MNYKKQIRWKTTSTRLKEYLEAAKPIGEEFKYYIELLVRAEEAEAIQAYARHKNSKTRSAAIRTIKKQILKEAKPAAKQNPGAALALKNLHNTQ